MTKTPELPHETIDSAELFVNQQFWNIAIIRYDVPPADGCQFKSIITRQDAGTGKYIRTTMIPNEVSRRQKSMMQAAEATWKAEYQQATGHPFDLFDPDTWPEPETPAENRQAADALLDEPEPVIIRTKAGPQYAFGALLGRPDGAGTQMSLI